MRGRRGRADPRQRPRARARRLAHRASSSRPLGELELKGLPAPSPCARSSGARGRRRRRSRFPRSSRPLPGVPVRRAALDASSDARRAWKETSEGARRAVLVSGEPGIGKTRSRHRAGAHTRTTTARPCCGAAATKSSASPYEPFAEALRHYVAACPPDRLRGGARSARRRADAHPARAHGTRSRASPSRCQTDAETERHRLFESVSDLLAEMSHTRTRWCSCSTTCTGPTSRRCSCSATSCDRRHRCGCSCSRPTATPTSTARIRSPTCSPTSVGTSRASSGSTCVGLDLAEVTDVHGVGGGSRPRRAGPRARAGVHNETQGNPFFVGEVLRHLAESGAIVAARRPLDERSHARRRRHPRGHSRSRRPPALAIVRQRQPSARTSRAVIGADVRPRDDRGRGRSDGRRALRRPRRGRAARPSSARCPAASGATRSAHALVRSTLYEELTTNRRVRMHWRVGEALERAPRIDDVDRHLDELAYHFAEGALAGDPLKAVDYCRRAARSSDVRARVRRGSPSSRPCPRHARARRPSRSSPALRSADRVGHRTPPRKRRSCSGRRLRRSSDRSGHRRC